MLEEVVLLLSFIPCSNMIKEKQLEVFLVLVTALMVLYLLFDEVYILYIALGLAITGLFIPFLRRYISFSWMKLAEVLSVINSKILLSLIYIFILLPVALIARIFRKDPLALSSKNKGSSTFSIRNHDYKAEDFENIF